MWSVPLPSLEDHPIQPPTPLRCYTILTAIQLRQLVFLVCTWSTIMVVSKKSRIRRDRIGSRDGGIMREKNDAKAGEDARMECVHSGELGTRTSVHQKTAGPSLGVFRVFEKT